MTSEDAAATLARGVRVRLPGDDTMFAVDLAAPTAAGTGLDLYLQDTAAVGALLTRGALTPVVDTPSGNDTSSEIRRMDVAGLSLDDTASADRRGFRSGSRDGYG